MGLIGDKHILTLNYFKSRIQFYESIICNKPYSRLYERYGLSWVN